MPATRIARRSASHTAPCTSAWLSRSAFLGTTSPSNNSNRPRGCSSTQARSCARVMRGGAGESVALMLPSEQEVPLRHR